MLNKQISSNLQRRSKNTQEWITRQLSDPYVKAAKYHNFRCRSAFKLIQINEKYKIINPGNIVIDCGAAPGSWSQVAAVECNSNQKRNKMPIGTVIGIDLLNIFPIEGVTFLNQSDFTTSETQNKIINLLNGEKVDVVLSDMAPNASGIKSLDHEKLIEMAYNVLKFAVINSKVNSNCLIKFWAGGRLTEIENDMRRFYSNVKYIKPDASRSDSAEIYLLARFFKGIKKIV
ncbi:hypothetical protein PGB90_007990 [Kerria lacca]